MNEPAYAVHDRIAVRRAAAPEGTQQRQTVDLYAHLLGHILQTYSDPGQLRSMALRKLAESLNDLLDHDQLVRAYRQRAATQQWSGGAIGYQVPPGGLAR